MDDVLSYSLVLHLSTKGCDCCKNVPANVPKAKVQDLPVLRTDDRGTYVQTLVQHLPEGLTQSRNIVQVFLPSTRP